MAAISDECGDLVASGENSHRKHAAKKQCDGNDISKNKWQAKKVKSRDVQDRSVVVDKVIDLFECIDDDEDDNKGEHREEKYLQELPDEVSVVNPHACCCWRRSKARGM